MLVGRVRGLKTDLSGGGSGCLVEDADAGGAGEGGEEPLLLRVQGAVMRLQPAEAGQVPGS